MAAGLSAPTCVG